MTPEEVLDRAREVIERDGWHQGAYCAPPDAEWKGGQVTMDEITQWREEVRYQMWLAERTGPVCSLGALARVLNENDSACPTDEHRDLFLKAGALLTSSIGILGPAEDVVPDWNDGSNTTREDVLLTFKKAAHHDT
ncbi:hypothetical protein [Streptomyces sp. NPDC015131]|uniref:DUF6197 family protein n=1 Tax=Streptomyces sp. NPDC015131 TaxID=3364941 RepID=UPI0037005EEC